MEGTSEAPSRSSDITSFNNDVIEFQFKGDTKNWRIAMTKHAYDEYVLIVQHIIDLLDPAATFYDHVTEHPEISKEQLEVYFRLEIYQLIRRWEHKYHFTFKPYAEIYKINGDDVNGNTYDQLTKTEIEIINTFNQLTYNAL